VSSECKIFLTFVNFRKRKILLNGLAYFSAGTATRTRWTGCRLETGIPLSRAMRARLQRVSLV